MQEIDTLVAEFHALLARDQAKAIGAVYARDSSRYQHSIADQVRGCRQAALQLGIFVARENIFFDLAVGESVIAGFANCEHLEAKGLERLRSLRRHESGGV